MWGGLPPADGAESTTQQNKGDGQTPRLSRERKGVAPLDMRRALSLRTVARLGAVADSRQACLQNSSVWRAASEAHVRIDAACSASMLSIRGFAAGPGAVATLLMVYATTMAHG